MKVGDLVSLKMKKSLPPQLSQHAIVTEIYKDVSGAEMVALWWIHGAQSTRDLHAESFEVLSER
jgi:hypothetical protein